MKIENFKSNNLYYEQLLHWRKSGFSSEELKESFEPKECKWGNDNVVAKDIFDSSSNETLKIFDKEWISKLEGGKTSLKDLIKIFLSNGYKRPEANEIIKQSRQNAFRAAVWSKANESIGGKASGFALLSLAAGVVKQVFFSHDSEIAASQNKDYKTMGPWDYLSKAVDFIYSLSRSQRNLHQYTMYSLPDDDAAMNSYQADVYGNKVAGSLAEVSTFLETKINPVLFPLSELLPKNLGEYFRKLAVLPSSLWWRARMPAYINQEFFTDFLKYIWHKPLSLLGGQTSAKQLLEIEKRGNLKWEYFVRRHKKNLGFEPTCSSSDMPMNRTESKEQELENNKRSSEIASSALPPRNDGAISMASRLVGTLAQLFHKDPVKQIDSAKKLGEFVAPVLGMYGFFTSALGNTSSAIFKLLNVENTFSKISNFIQASSIYSQQLIYLPKIMIPFLSETRMIGRLINDSNVKEKDDIEKIEQLKDLYEKRKVISGVGIGSFLLHTVNIIGKGINFKWIGLVDEVACNLTNIFFSNRRHLMGMQFRIENPEFVD